MWSLLKNSVKFVTFHVFKHVSHSRFTCCNRRVQFILSKYIRNLKEESLAHSLVCENQNDWFTCNVQCACINQSFDQYERNIRPKSHIPTEYGTYFVSKLYLLFCSRKVSMRSTIALLLLMLFFLLLLLLV